MTKDKHLTGALRFELTPAGLVAYVEEMTIIVLEADTEAPDDEKRETFAVRKATIDDLRDLKLTRPFISTRLVNGDKNQKAWRIAGRTIGLPVFATMGLIFALLTFLKYLVNYIRFGGESIAYTHAAQPTTINDLYKELTKNK